MNTHNKIGVVIGRFQTPYLHEGHRFLLDHALHSTDRLLILIGDQAAWATHRDPLDFQTRKVMVERAYPQAIVRRIVNMPSDRKWSNQLDTIIAECAEGCTPVLFGSRDSFIPHYCGAHECVVVDTTIIKNATELRSEVAATPLDSHEFRAGVMYAHTKQGFPTSFQAVDIIVKHSTRDEVLVGRKAGEEKWQFPGGFVDPRDNSLEQAAKREAVEELGDIEIDDLRYIGSFRIDDYRYRRGPHRIMSAVYVATYVYGHVRAQDDLEEVRWQSIDDLEDCLVEAHKPLALAFKNKNQ